MTTQARELARDLEALSKSGSLTVLCGTFKEAAALLLKLEAVRVAAEAYHYNTAWPSWPAWIKLRQSLKDALGAAEE